MLAAGAMALPAAAVEPLARVAFNAGLTTSRPDVVTVAADGTDVRNLTPGESTSYTADLDPSWSPDGKQIAFDSHRDSSVSTEIYLMDADGSNQHRLTRDSGQNQIFNMRPLWSPRGDLIAFEKSVNGQAYDVWVIRPDGSDLRQLTGDGGIKRDVSWSPDGTRLAYTRSDSAGSRIYTVGLDGAPPLALSPAESQDTNPAWSPDGSQIAFSAPALTVMNADGSGRSALTQISTSGPAWSPDGMRIAFSGLRPFPRYSSPRFGTPTRQDVFVIDVTGRNLRRLTGPFADDALYGPAGGQQPTWWPDASRLFYISQRPPGPFTTFVMNADGSCEARFGAETPDLLRPVWQPRKGAFPPPTRCAELRLTASIAKDRLALSETASWTFTVDNGGNIPATRVRIEVGIDTSYGTVLSSRSPDCTSTATSVTCVLERIAPGQSSAVAIEGSRQTAGPIRLESQVSANELDTDPSNNSSLTGADVLPCTIVGSWNADTLYGTDRADRICALPGADTIVGRAGNDYIDAGNGDDRIYGGRGRDTIIARGGQDVIYARDGERDWIDCGTERDVAVIDRSDTVRHCELVARPAR